MTIFLIVITVGVSYMAFQNLELFNKLKFNAYMIWHKKDYARILSHGLIHSDWMHLGVNMFVLYSFGEAMEDTFSSKIFFPETYYYGKFLFVLMYVLAVAFASVPSLIKHRNNHYYNAVGASGAVSAVVFTSILISPTSEITLLILPFLPLPNYVFGALYVAYSIYMGKKSKDNVAHDAHIAGAVFGFLFPIILNPYLFNNFVFQVFGVFI